MTARPRLTRILLALSVLIAMSVHGTGHAAAATTVGLGDAAPFAVLAGTPHVSNTGPTVVDGDLGISPAVDVIGFGGAGNGTVTGATLTGAAAADAKDALTTAYLDAEARPLEGAALTGPALQGLNLGAGVYSWPSLSLDGTLTLTGDADDVFILKSGAALDTEVGSVVQLMGGAQACNVFWQVTSSATLKTNSTFVGTIMALTDIAAQNGTTVDGRLLARNGAVTLDDNDITRSDCAAVVVPPPPAAPTTTTTSTTTTSTTVAPTTTTTAVPTTTTTAVAVPVTAAPVAPTPAPVSHRSAPGGSSTGITGELPRTGPSTGTLAGLGLGGLLMGAGLVLVSSGPPRAGRRSTS